MSSTISSRVQLYLRWYHSAKCLPQKRLESTVIVDVYEKNREDHTPVSTTDSSIIIQIPKLNRGFPVSTKAVDLHKSMLTSRTRNKDKDIDETLAITLTIFFNK